MSSIGKIIGFYVALRDEKAEIEARHKEELAPIKEKMQMAEAALQKLMLEQDVTQLKDKATGTAYLQEFVSTKVDDWGAVMEHIRQHDRWDLLERRVNKTAVLDGEEVPGVTISKSLKVNVRRA